MQALAARHGPCAADRARRPGARFRRLGVRRPDAHRPRSDAGVPRRSARRRLVRAPACARRRRRASPSSISASAPRPTSRASRRAIRTRSIGDDCSASSRGAARRFRRRRASRPAITTCTGAISSTTARGSSRSTGNTRVPATRRRTSRPASGYHALDAHGDRRPARGLRRGARAALRARVAALAWIFDCLWYGWNAAAAGPRARARRRRTGAARGAAGRVSGCTDTGASGKMRDPWPRSP